MAKKFNLSENMLNGISKNTEKVATLEAKENFKIEYIDIDKIIRNERNFYEINNIEELIEDISINGLNHNLVVRPAHNGLYELISGERRYTALKELVNKGEERFKKVPCKITNLNDLDSEIVLIQANAQSRELSESDKLIQVRRLTELYNMKKKKGEKVGKVRELISKDTGLSTSQVGRYSIINKKLIPELRDILDEGNLSISNASEFAVLSVENQKVILDIIQNKISISKNEANDLKNKFKAIEKEKEDLLKKEKQIYEQRLKELEKNNLFLEEEKRNLIEKLSNKINDEDIDKIAIEKANKIALNFKNEKKKIEDENKKIKNELKESKKDDNKISLNKELNIRLKNVRQEMSRVTGLMANNTIIDEITLKEVNKLKLELRFLNEQIEVYTNQEKII